MGSILVGAGDVAGLGCAAAVGRTVRRHAVMLVGGGTGCGGGRDGVYPIISPDRLEQITAGYLDDCPTVAGMEGIQCLLVDHIHQLLTSPKGVLHSQPDQKSLVHENGFKI